MNFRNKKINKIEVSRYIASWVNAGGHIYGVARKDELFLKWLRSLIINHRQLLDHEIDYIYKYACGGKFELEESAKEFLKEGV